MPFNPAEFVTPWAPLGQYDLGRGLRSLANHNRETARLEEQKRQANMQQLEQRQSRQDLNTRFAGQLASDRADTDYATALKKHADLEAQIEAARKAAINNPELAQALAGRVKELGGTVEMEAGSDPRYPAFIFKAPPRPERAPVDFQGVRKQIFGAPNGTIGAPFMLRGSNPAEGNPFEALPGASAALLGPQPQAPADDPPAPAAAEPPPPGAASDPAAGGSGAPPAGVSAIPTVGDRAAAPAAPALPEAPPAEPTSSAPATDLGPQQQPLQLQQPQVGRNPFDPFRLDTGALMASRGARLNDYLEGARQGIPSSYQDRFNALNAGVAGLGLDLDDSLKIWQPTFNTLAGLIGDEYRAQQAKASLGVRQEAAANTRNDRLVNQAHNFTKDTAQQYDIKKLNNAYMSTAKATDLLDDMTGHSDTAAIHTLYNMYAVGIVTDKDFAQLQDGAVQSWVDGFKKKLDGVFNSRLPPVVRANLRKLVGTLKDANARELNLVQDQMLARAEEDRVGSEDAFHEIVNFTAGAIPRPLWNDTLKKYRGVRVPKKTGPMDNAGNYEIEPSKPSPPPDKRGKPTVRIQRDGKWVALPADQLTEDEFGQLPEEDVKRLLGN
jgi:hypothetical protein